MSSLGNEVRWTVLKLLFANEVAGRRTAALRRNPRPPVPADLACAKTSGDGSTNEAVLQIVSQQTVTSEAFQHPVTCWLKKLGVCYQIKVILIPL